jgi:zinc D-Ala-D-Ala carboxypeptidase
MRLSPSFTLAEFTASATATSLRLNNQPSKDELARLVDHAWLLERLRFDLGNKPIVITSGFRNEELNNAVGGVANSDHRLGYASDFKIAGLAPKEIIAVIRNNGYMFDQAIDEFGRWVHLSTNPRNRKELLRAVKRGNRTVYLPFKD